MKKNILLIIFIACNLWLSFVLISNKQNCDTQLSLLKEKSIDNFKAHITDTFIKTISYEDSRVKVSISAKNTISDLYSKGKDIKLIYRLNFPYCGSCIFPVIEELDAKCDEMGVDNIIIVSSFPNKEYAEDFDREMSDKKLRVINIPDIDFSLDNNGFNGSYLFLMDSSLHQESLFFTNKFNLFMLNDYLNFINNSMK